MVYATDNVDGNLNNIEMDDSEIYPYYNAELNNYAFYVQGKFYIEYTAMDEAGNIGVLIIEIIILEQEIETSYEGYYSSIDGKTGYALEDALYTLLNNTGGPVTTTYGAARDILGESDVWVGFNTKYLNLIYSDTIGGTPNNYSKTAWDSGATWNREHVWPKSQFGTGSYDPNTGTRGIEADMHNLRASDTRINSNRGNLPFTSAVNNASGYGKVGSAWYPGNSHRGDVARIVFYMDIRWGSLTTISKVGTIKTLLEWHELDPVDDFEINRNNVIYKYQKNRNPFIDHPELASAIYQ